MPNHLVFISHAGADTWMARQISQRCREVGAQIFLDEADIHIGADFETAIYAALRDASEILVFITPWALERPYVWMEIGVAGYLQIPIVVVLNGLSTAEFQGRAHIPVSLRGRNVIDINAIDRYFDELERRVKRQLPPVEPR